MTAGIVAAAIVAGGLAAVVRYLVSRAVARVERLPLAVLIVNVAGSTIGGVAVGLATTGSISTDLRLVVLGGVAGGLTTFSTLSVETMQLALDGKWRTALSSIALNLVLGLAAALGGFAFAVGV